MMHHTQAFKEVCIVSSFPIMQRIYILCGSTISAIVRNLRHFLKLWYLASYVSSIVLLCVFFFFYFSRKRKNSKYIFFEFGSYTFFLPMEYSSRLPV